MLIINLNTFFLNTRFIFIYFTLKNSKPSPLTKKSKAMFFFYLNCICHINGHSMTCCDNAKKKNKNKI